jgi:thiol peroxidase
MATITFKGAEIHTTGDLPPVGSAAPDFVLVRQDLSEARLADYAGRTIVMNVFPSIDTPVCATSVKRFNEEAAGRDGVVVLNVSADLPFAAKRFCGAEGIEGVQTLSTFRGAFARDYGVEMADGPLAGLCARAVLVVDGSGTVRHVEQVPDVAQEPDYAAAMAAIG